MSRPQFFRKTFASSFIIHIILFSGWPGPFAHKLAQPFNLMTRSGIEPGWGPALEGEPPPPTFEEKNIVCRGEEY